MPGIFWAFSCFGQLYGLKVQEKKAQVNVFIQKIEVWDISISYQFRYIQSRIHISRDIWCQKVNFVKKPKCIFLLNFLTKFTF